MPGDTIRRMPMPDPHAGIRTIPTSRPDGPRVLVVEDDPAQLTMIASAMRSRGYRVLEAATGSAALDQAATIEADVVLLDLGLPDLDGIDVCQKLRVWS